jgi:hypothetical protein
MKFVPICNIFLMAISSDPCTLPFYSVLPTPHYTPACPEPASFTAAHFQLPSPKFLKQKEILLAKATEKSQEDHLLLLAHETGQRFESWVWTPFPPSPHSAVLQGGLLLR